MANFYSDQYSDAYIEVPKTKIAPGEVGGEAKILYMSHTVGVADELATTDTLFMGKLPKGARVVESKFKCPATGATGIFNIGYQANGVDVADLDAYHVGVDPGAAAVYAAGTGAGLGKKLGAETNVVITPTEITADAGGKTLELWITYVVR